MHIAKKKSSILFIITAFLLFVMSCGGFYNIYITNSISSDALVINKLGSIRGSMQRVVKLVLNNEKCDEVINKVDLTLGEFKTEKIKLFDQDHEIMGAIQEVENSWSRVKLAINQYKLDPSDDNRLQLLKESEDAWYKSNNMVFISQISSENKVSKYKLSVVAFVLNVLLSIAIIILIKRYVKDTLETAVNYDSLTGAYNRRSFSEFLHNEIIRSERYNRPFSLIMLDIDFFKKINDTYGHDVGDKVLQELTILVSSCIRKTDIFARVGGEEFSVIAPETNSQTAALLAEKIRKAVEANVFAANLSVTISLGISEYKNQDDQNAIYKRADNALYSAKSNGRNRSEIAA